MRKKGSRWLHVIGLVSLMMMAQPASAKSVDDWGVRVTPADRTTEVAPDAVITVTFAERVLLKNNKELTNKSLSSLVQLTDAKKKRVPFTAKWDKASRILTVDPVGNLEAGQSYTFTLLEQKLVNGQKRLNPKVNSTFSTKKAVDNIAPRAVILPGHGAKQVKLQDKVTLSFAEEVALVDGRPFVSKTAGSLVRVTDDKGTAYAHTVTWNKSKRTLTVKPKGGKWQPHTTYQVTLAAGKLKDNAGNLNAAQVSSFSTGGK